VSFACGRPFSLFRKSILVVDSSQLISPKVPRRCDYQSFSYGALLHIRTTKTIQFFQRALTTPLLVIPGSPLCPVTALHNRLRLNASSS